MKDLSNEKTNDLYNAILLLEDKNEAKKFFRDLLTEDEIAEFSNRFRVARMLEKEISYSKITQATGMSSTTIARISKWLNQGMNGYKLMLKKVNHHHNNFSPLEKGLC